MEVNAELEALPRAGIVQENHSASEKSGADSLEHLSSAGRAASKAASRQEILPPEAVTAPPSPRPPQRHRHLLSVPSDTEHGRLSVSPDR